MPDSVFRPVASDIPYERCESERVVAEEVSYLRAVGENCARGKRRSGSHDDPVSIPRHGDIETIVMKSTRKGCGRALFSLRTRFTDISDADPAGF